MLNTSQLNNTQLNALAINQCNALALLPLVTNGSIVNDVSLLATDEVTNYAAKLLVGSEKIEVPISSWQATIQNADQNYAQCVIPAAADYADDIAAATGFEIYSRVIIGSADPIDYLLFSSTINNVQQNVTPSKFTVTLSGYFSETYVDNSADPAFDRALQGIRSINTANGIQTVRCNLDFLLKPLQTVSTGQSADFVAKYINYFVNVRDAYMDVGDRS